MAAARHHSVLRGAPVGSSTDYLLPWSCLEFGRAVPRGSAVTDARCGFLGRWRPRGPPGQTLRLPAVRPAMMFFCKIKKKTIVGTAAMASPAMITIGGGPPEK